MTLDEPTKSEQPRKPPEILRFFEFQQLPDHLKSVSAECYALAYTMEEILPPSAEKSAGLRKLLEAKDCFVRAALSPRE